MEANDFMLNRRVNYNEVARVIALLSTLPQPNLEANVGDQQAGGEEVYPGNNVGADEEVNQELFFQICVECYSLIPDTITIIKSEKGKDKAVYRGFPFRADYCNENGTKQYWRCDKLEVINEKCKARLHSLVTHNVFVKFLPHSQLEAHNHAFDPMIVPVSNVKTSLKCRAVDTREKPKELLNHELQSAPSAFGPTLSDSAVRKMVRRVRVANQVPIVEGKRVQNIDIPTALQTYLDGSGRQELFLLGDSGRDDQERILLFGRQKHIVWSGEMRVVYMDGSFSITLPPFYQVYAVLAERSARVANGGKWVFPVLYALLKSKTRAGYTKLFKMIRDLWPDFCPFFISVDFEQAAIQSLIEVFPESQIAGCLFHLVRNFKKKIGSCGLNGQYHEPEFSVLARMIISLSFVPPAEIWACFELLQNHLPADLAPILTWFKRYYVGIPHFLFLRIFCGLGAWS